MQQEQLPLELEEKVISLIPTTTLFRFRSVCKRWNTLFKERRFFNSDLGPARPQIILHKGSKICSVDVNLDGPSIEVHNLSSYIPGYENSRFMIIDYSDGLLIYDIPEGTGICNPWLRQMRWVETRANLTSFTGMGYDNSKIDKHYKILQTYLNIDDDTVIANITDIRSNVMESYEFASDKLNYPWGSYYNVSLNGNLYWVVYNNHQGHFIQSFDFSTERFKAYCVLPTKITSVLDASSLAVFRGDRFSFLKQNYDTRNIEIWVTKEKIQNRDGESVEWIKLMNVSVPKWSSLKVVRFYPPSYFIHEDKSLTLVLCCHNNMEKAHIYIANGDKFHEIEINDFVEDRPFHRTYFPSLVPVPIFTMSGKDKTQRVEYRFTPPRGVEGASNGVGEKEWDDGFFDNVKKITVGQGQFGGIFVKFDYSNGDKIVAGATHGNDSFNESLVVGQDTHGNATDHNSVLIDDDDYIKAVEGTYTESHITSIAFRLHKRYKSVQYGNFNGSFFKLGGGNGSKIIGFYGKHSDDNLTALGIHLSPSN